MSTLLLLIYIILIIAGIINKKSHFLFIITFLFAWILIAGNYQNADYGQYVQRYGWGKDILVDFGFSFLCQFFLNFGFEYQGFKAVVSFICLLMIFRSINKLSPYSSFGAALFLLFPFVIDVTQFRNFIAYSIVFYAIPFLFHEGRNNVIKYVIIVLLASSIHATSLFYLLFVFSKIKLNKYHVITCVIFAFVVKETLKAYLTIKYETGKLDDMPQSSLAGALFNVFIICMTVLMIWYACKRNRMHRSICYVKDLKYRFEYDKTWLMCNMLLFMLIPFVMDSGNYERIYRNIAVLNMLFVYGANLKKQQKTLIIFAYYSYFVIFTYIIGDSELTFWPTFIYNSFF